MATIKRASGYFTYIFAVLISGMFGVLGKPAPTWAQNVKSSRSETIFNENFFGTLRQGNQAGVGSPSMTVSQSSERAFKQPSEGSSTQSVDSGRAFKQPSESSFTQSIDSGRAFKQPSEGSSTQSVDSGRAFKQPSESSFTQSIDSGRAFKQPSESSSTQSVDSGRAFKQPSESSFTQSIDSGRAFKQPSEGSSTQSVDSGRAFKQPDSNNTFSVLTETATPEQIQSVHHQVDETLESIKLKVRNNESLTPEELSLLVSVENAQRLEQYLQSVR